jgi:adenine-specific DNA-methyltransferase
MLWEEMQRTGFLSYKVRPEAINDNIREFAALSPDEQRLFLGETLDANMLYVPLGELDDADYGLNDADKRLTRQFYDGNRS